MDLHLTPIHRLILGLVADQVIVWHPGCWGHVQGFAWFGGDHLTQDEQDAAHDLRHASLVGIGEHAEPKSKGNPVRVTRAGMDRLGDAALRAAAWGAIGCKPSPSV